MIRFVENLNQRWVWPLCIALVVGSWALVIWFGWKVMA